MNVPVADPAGYRALHRPRNARHIEVLDQRVLPHAVQQVRIGDRGPGRAGHPADVGPRRAADRGRRRLRPRDGARPRRLRRRARRAPTPRSTPPGPRPSTCAGRSTGSGTPSPRCRPASAPTRRGARRTRSSSRTSPSTARSASTASSSCTQIARRKPGPVQVMTHCNAGALATCGFGHGHGADLPRARRGPRRPRLGVGDTAATAGRQPDGLGDGAARRPLHALRGRGERGADASRRRGPRAGGGRPRRPQRRRLQQDRHLRQGAGRARQQRPVLRRPALADDRLVARLGRRPSRSSSATPARCCGSPGATSSGRRRSWPSPRTARTR